MAKAGPRAEVSLVSALTTAARGVAGVVESALRREGLGLDHWLVLQALVAATGLSMADLAARTLVTGPTLTRVTDRLVTNALVYREVDAGDRRRVRVYLSPRGTALYRRLAPAIERIEHELLDRSGLPGLTPDLAKLAESARDHA